MMAGREQTSWQSFLGAFFSLSGAVLPYPGFRFPVGPMLHYPVLTIKPSLH